MPLTPLHRRAAAFGLVAALASSVGQSFFIGLFGVSIRASLGLGEAAWGAIYGGATLASGLLMFWLGGLADSLQLRRAITLALGLLAAGALLVALAQSVWMLLLGLFCLRLGGQGLAGHLAIVAAARHARRRGRGIATAAFGFILGEALLPWLVVAALLRVPAPWVWFGAVVLVLGLALPALRWLAAPLPRAARLAAGAIAPARLRRRNLVRTPVFLAALSVVLISPFVVTAVFLHQGTLAALKGWTPAGVASAFTGFAATQAVATWLAGRWVDRHGAGRVLRIYLWPVGLAMLLLAFAPPAWALWGLFLGLGLTAGGNSVVSGALWADVFGTDNLGLVRGVYTGFMVMTTAISPLLLGLALERGFSLATLAMGVAAYVALVPWLAARVLDAGGALVTRQT